MSKKVTNIPVANVSANTGTYSDVSGLIAKLPPSYTKRWMVRRKATVVQAVRSGSISLQEVGRRYNLSVDEFRAWERSFDSYGIPGLRVTRIQIYRDTDAARAAKQIRSA